MGVDGYQHNELNEGVFFAEGAAGLVDCHLRGKKRGLCLQCQYLQ